MVILDAGPAATIRSPFTTTTAFEMVVAFVTSIIRAARMAVTCCALSGEPTIKINAPTNANIFRFISNSFRGAEKLTLESPPVAGQHAKRGGNAFDRQVRRRGLMKLAVALVERSFIEVKRHPRGSFEGHF